MTEAERIGAAIALADAALRLRNMEPDMAKQLAEEATRQLSLLNPVVLTEGDALADLNGTPRPDNPTV